MLIFLESEKLSYEQSGGVTMLAISDLTRQDAGKYYLNLESSAGNKEYVINLHVFGKNH